MSQSGRDSSIGSPHDLQDDLWDEDKTDETKQ